MGTVGPTQATTAGYSNPYAAHVQSQHHAQRYVPTYYQGGGAMYNPPVSQRHAASQAHPARVVAEVRGLNAVIHGVRVNAKQMFVFAEAVTHYPWRP
jgi:hypothetical protein